MNKSTDLEGRIERQHAASAYMMALPGYLEGLLNQISDSDPVARAAAASEVALLGKPAATPLVLAALERLLDDNDLQVRSEAICAVGRMGRAAVERPGLLTSLARQLALDVPEITEAVVQTLAFLPWTRATGDDYSTVRDGLLELDKSPDAGDHLRPFLGTALTAWRLSQRRPPADRPTVMTWLGAVPSMGFSRPPSRPRYERGVWVSGTEGSVETGDEDFGAIYWQACQDNGSAYLVFSSQSPATQDGIWRVVMANGAVSFLVFTRLPIDDDVFAAFAKAPETARPIEISPVFTSSDVAQDEYPVLQESLRTLKNWDDYGFEAGTDWLSQQPEDVFQLVTKSSGSDPVPGETAP